MFGGFYAEAQAPHHDAAGFHNNYPHDAKQSFWLWKWEQLKHGVPEPPPGPAQAVQVRDDLRAARAVGMHWGTFGHLTDEPLDEPPRLLARDRGTAGLAQDEFDVMKVGETRAIRPREATRR